MHILIQSMGAAMYFRIFWFIVNYLASFVGVALLMQLLQFVPGLQSGLAAMLALPLLIAAMIEGQHYARAQRAGPPASKCWFVALKMSALVGVVAFTTFLLFAFWQRQYGWPSLNIVIIAVATLPLLRIGYAIGLSSELKGQRVSTHVTS